MRQLITLLLALGAGLISTLPLADTVTAEAEQQYQQALAAMSQARQALIEPAQMSPERLDTLRKSIDSNLESAIDSGHPAAALYQAQLTLNATNNNSAARQQACSRLDSWARKGFVAAAVVNFTKCDRAYLRFDFANPEHQAILQGLAESLAQNDPAQAYYPFPLAASQCFSADSTQAVALSQNQFRAEAEFILGSTQEPKDAESLRSSLKWLDAAANHGCQMTLDLRPALREQLKKQ